MNIKDTYFGFTNGKKEMQAARIEKSLDILIRSDGEYLTNKEFIYKRLTQGYTLGIEEDYSYWSNKKQDYTKPRTLYKLQNTNDHTFYEINKTLYEYALHLLNNDFLSEEKASQFIQNEIAENEEKERLEQERVQKEREKAEKQRQQEEQERKERLKQRQNEWIEQGKEFISRLENNPITEVLDSHWKEIKSIYKDEDKEAFYNNMTNRFTMMLGNKNGCIGWMKYFIERENDEYNSKLTLKSSPIQFLEKEILFNVFNDIELTDKEITITAKVKAKFENREYKGGSGKQTKEHKFYYLERDPETTLREFKEAYGQKLIINGITCYLRTIKDNKYCVIEARTGLGVSGVHSNKSKAITTAKEKVNDNKEKLEQIINKQIELGNLSPLYQDKEAI